MQLGTKRCILAFLEYKDLGHKGPFTFYCLFFLISFKPGRISNPGIYT